MNNFTLKIDTDIYVKCNECGESLEFDVSFYRDGSLEISVEMCTNCLNKELDHLADVIKGV